MPPRPITAEQAKAAQAAVNDGCTLTEVARNLGIARSTLREHMARATSEQDRELPSSIELPTFPDEDIPVEQIIDHMAQRFAKRQASYDAHTWFPVKIKESKPIGVLFVGDPHVDDDGCAWPILREHCEIARKTQGLYAINIGDSANWWTGRLIKKYADQESSAKTARRLVEWLMLDSGVRWLLILCGNHDAWGEGSLLLQQMAKRYGTRNLVCHDWEARFVLKFPNGSQSRVFAAHDFPGHSMWNPLHGNVKAAKFGNDIDVLVCGHRHNYAVSQWELPEQGHAPLMVRVRGYKHLDDYARRLGLQEQQEGQSILVIFDPNAKTRAGRAQAFVDVAQGADYLTWLRSR